MSLSSSWVTARFKPVLRAEQPRSGLLRDSLLPSLPLKTEITPTWAGLKAKSGAELQERNCELASAGSSRSWSCRDKGLAVCVGQQDLGSCSKPRVAVRRVEVVRNSQEIFNIQSIIVINLWVFS